MHLIKLLPPVRKQKTISSALDDKYDNSALKSCIDNLSNSIQELSEKMYNKQKQVNLKDSKVNEKEDCDYSSTKYKHQDMFIPKINSQTNSRRYEIEQFLGNSCRTIFPMGFSMLKSEQLTEKQVKIFCSQKLLFAIISFIKQNDLSQQQIQSIDTCLEYKLLPYFSAKYPMSDQLSANTKLDNLIILKNNMDDSENDLLGRTSYFLEFRFKQSQNYNQEIMKFLNFMIQQSNRLSKGFDKDITELFTKIYQQSFMIDLEDANPRNIKPQKYRIIQKLPQPHNQNRILSKQQENISAANEEQLRQRIQYRQKISSYTSYSIGKKLPDHTRTFSQKDILQQNLVLTDPAIIRIITKWCQQLQQYFQTGFIINRQKPFRMKDRSVKYLQKKWMLIVLSGLLQKHKQIPKKYLENVRKNSSNSQSVFGKSDIDQQLKLFSEQEATVGKFATLMFQNCGNYLKGYLNALIHGITTALQQFEKIIKYSSNGTLKNAIKNYMSNIHQQNLNKLIKQSDKDWNKQGEDVDHLIPQLITCKIGDLLRCKCSSKEQQIKALYCYLQLIDAANPDFLKIIRVKNRLGKGTNDILINLRYRNQSVIQMQLAVNMKTSKYIDNSNKFSHYLYELERAIFGPINQMCSIWAAKDSRSKFYFNSIQKNNVRTINNKNQDQIKCLHKNRKILFLPFKCKNCNFYYFDCQASEKHINCSQCIGEICFLCQFQSSNNKDKNLQLGLNSQIQQQKLDDSKFIYQNGCQISAIVKEIPDSGCIVNLKRRKISQFVKHIYNDKILLLQPPQNNHNFSLIYQLNLKDQQAIRKIFIQNIIRARKLKKTIKDQQILSSVKFKYLLPKYLKNCYKTHKSSIILIGENINLDFIKSVHPDQTDTKQFVRYLNLAQNQLEEESFKIISNVFPKIQQLILNENKLNVLPPQISKLDSLKHLSIKNNQIKTIPASLKQLNKLTHFDISENQLYDATNCFKLSEDLTYLDLSINNIEAIPQDIDHLTRLKILKVSRNKLKSIPSSFCSMKNLRILQLFKNRIQTLPQQLFQNMQQLTVFNAMNNKLQNLPNSIGKASNLCELYLSSNQLVSLPESFWKLKKLLFLYIRNNSLINLPEDFGNLTRLKILEISYNKIQKLPEAFCEIKSIQKIYASFNKFIQIPKQFGQLQKITHLDLSFNQLVTIPESLSKLIMLQELHLRNNKLQRLPDIFGQMKQLVKLTLQNTNIETLPQSLYSLKIKELRVNFDTLQENHKMKLTKKKTDEGLKIVNFDKDEQT